MNEQEKMKILQEVIKVISKYDVLDGLEAEIIENGKNDNEILDDNDYKKLEYIEFKRKVKRLKSNTAKENNK